MSKQTEQNLHQYLIKTQIRQLSNDEMTKHSRFVSDSILLTIFGNCWKNHSSRYYLFNQMNHQTDCYALSMFQINGQKFSVGATFSLYINRPNVVYCKNHSKHIQN